MTPAGAYHGVSEPSVGYDPRHHVWLIAFLVLVANQSEATDVIVARSTDHGLTWSTPTSAGESRRSA